MIVLALSIAAAAAAASGTYMLKSVTTKVPTWQAVGPLLAINALLIVPFIPFGPSWQALNPKIALLHLLSVALLCGSTACVFTLITRGRASAVAVGQALAPAATLVAAPLMLGTQPHLLTAVGALALMLGSLIPLRHAFAGFGSARTIALLFGYGSGIGLLTVTTALLVRQGVGLPEMYVVRTFIGAAVFMMIAPPRAVRPRDLPALASRSAFVTASFVLTILAVQTGDVIVIQSVLATQPLMVMLIEWRARKGRPDPSILAGSLIAVVGLTLLLTTTG